MELREGYFHRLNIISHLFCFSHFFSLLFTFSSISALMASDREGSSFTVAATASDLLSLINNLLYGRISLSGKQTLEIIFAPKSKRDLHQRSQGYLANTLEAFDRAETHV